MSKRMLRARSGAIRRSARRWKSAIAGALVTTPMMVAQPAPELEESTTARPGVLLEAVGGRPAGGPWLPAEVSRPRVPEEGSFLLRVEVLRPAAGSAEGYALHVLHWSDGGSTLASSGSLAVGDDPDVVGRARTIGFEVDFERGRYTVRVEAEEAVRRSDLGLPPADRTKTLDSNQGYWLHYRVETWEPAKLFFPVAGLTRTEINVEWSDCEDFAVQLDDFRPDCWANPNTFINTTWFEDSCWDWFNNLGFSIFAMAEGQYHNDDFFFDILPTYVTESVEVDIFWGGDVNPRAFHRKSGHFAGFLTGVIREASGTTYDRCPPPSGGGGGGGGGSGGGGSGGGDGGGDTGGGGDAGGGGGSGGGDGDDDDCVPVYDGETGDYLGDCCGSNAEILECAEGFLE